MRHLRGLTLAILLVLAACSGVLPSAPADADPVFLVQPDVPADTVLVTIAAAVAQPGQPAFVGGMLLIDADGTAWLCDALAESFPPQCGGERLRIANVAAATLPKLASGGGASWSEAPIQLLGSVRLP